MRVLLVMALALGALIGVPMDPEKVRELLSQLNQPKVAETLPERSDDGEDLKEYLRRNGLK